MSMGGPRLDRRFPLDELTIYTLNEACDDGGIRGDLRGFAILT